FFLSSRRRHTRCYRDWSSDVCSSDLGNMTAGPSIASFVAGWSGPRTRPPSYKAGYRWASGHVSRTHFPTPRRASLSETSQVRDRPRVRERIQELRGLAAARLARFSANEV